MKNAKKIIAFLMALTLLYYLALYCGDYHPDAGYGCNNKKSNNQDGIDCKA